jgi:hypothetical protein
MPDPFVADLFARQPGAQRPWVKAVTTSHIWAGALPASLSAGAHRLTIRARDEYGGEVVAHMLLEVAERGGPAPA